MNNRNNMNSYSLIIFSLSLIIFNLTNYDKSCVKHCGLPWLTNIFYILNSRNSGNITSQRVYLSHLACLLMTLLVLFLALWIKSQRLCISPTLTLLSSYSFNKHKHHPLPTCIYCYYFNTS